jgi:thiol-disulfide isomerase/thioredoxin
MRNPAKVFKLLIISLILVIAESTLADKAATDISANIKVPFGIRNYDIGVAQNFTLNDIDGEKFDLADSRGQWVFLHFWASWCGPCREEMPTLQTLADSLRDENFQIVMVNTAEDEDTIFEFLSAIDVELNSLMDVDGMVTEIWKPRGLPTTFLINPKGEVKYQAIGGREWNKPEYINFIKQLIENH